MPERVAELKASTAGDVVVAGSLQLLQTLVAHRLVDTFQIWVHPVLLGSGKRLIEPVTPALLGLRPVAATVTRSGLVALTYEA
nr:dihydrofolate reductase family protein [Nocardioides speluncae]